MTDRRLRVALAGNPNCGKTTIFNRLTGGHQRVGNYSGVTVERVTGICKLSDGRQVEIVDLPGIYSLSNGSPEERVAFTELVSGQIDLVVDVVDSGNAQRNLYLTTQLAELGIPMVIDFNMVDDAEKAGLQFNFPKFSSFFGARIVKTVGSTGFGIQELRGELHRAATGDAPGRPIAPKFGPLTEEAITHLVEEIAQLMPPSLGAVPPRCIAVKLLENDPHLGALPEFSALGPTVRHWQDAISARNGIAIDALIADFRYGVVAGACREAITVRNDSRRRISACIDTIVTNRFLGVPIFLGVMYAMFWITFSLGKYPMEAMANCFAALGEAVTSMWPAGRLVLLEQLVVDGIIGGVGGVLVFLPNIMLLFMCIAFLEGTGYMSRAAFVMDGFMHVFGLHGKSFIPMLLGFGCSVPAVMATRTIESERDRMTTIMVVPFMSCSARLPIYAMMAPAFFSPAYSPLVGWLMYVIGTIVALLAARILKSTIFSGDDEVFVMELPPYRMPTLQSVLIQMWERAVLYIRKAGTLILGASVVIFLLSTFPVKKDFSRDYRAMEEEVLKSTAPEEEKTAELERIGALRKAELLEYSMTGKIGHALETVMRPLGFDWRVSSALVGAAAAKEIFVAQLGVLFASGDSGASRGRLQPMLAAAYTRLEGFCIMLFCLLTFPCIATLAAVRRETGSWKWVAFQVALFIGTAYIITLLVHQIGLHWH